MTAALIAHSALTVHFRTSGTHPLLAKDLAYLVVPLVLLFLTIPIWRSAALLVAANFRRADLSLRIIVIAVAIGVLLRLAWRLTMYLQSDDSTLPVFSIHCEPFVQIALALFVSALLIPVIEETVHRGYLFAALMRFGAVPATLVSRAVFTVYHRQAIWPLAFIGGVVFAVQYWRTGSLWSSTISHMTFNTLSQLDSRCCTWRKPMSAKRPGATGRPGDTASKRVRDALNNV